MIISSCPLRISLVGGSTDHPEFLKKYGEGSVISFPCNLKTYVSVHKDVFGTNSLGKKYILNYSKREEINSIQDIKNELIRYTFEELEVPQINLFLTSDVPSVGSGLASSSSYIMSIIKAIFTLNNKKITDSEVCKLALKIERKFNFLVGQQDFYGSMGGFKKIKFFHDKDPQITYLDTTIFNFMDMYLLHTGITRSSTDVLKTINIDSSLPLLQDTIDLEKSINDVDVAKFNSTIRTSWINKKKTSEFICSNQHLEKIDQDLSTDDNVLSHKLLGAGNGGYFLIFTEKNKTKEINERYKNIQKINISELGLQSNKI